MRRHRIYSVKRLPVIAVVVILSLFLTGILETGADPEYPLPEGKQEVYDRLATQKAIGIANALPAGQTLGPLPEMSPVPTVSGIIEVSQSPFDEAAIDNQWIGTVDAKRFSIAAGSVKWDQTQGFIGTQHGYIGEGASFASYLTPSKDGPVRVVSADGMRVTLATANGTTYLYDVVARQLYTSLGVPIATTTVPPPPTVRPYPPPIGPYPVPESLLPPTPTGEPRGWAFCAATALVSIRP